MKRSKFIRPGLLEARPEGEAWVVGQTAQVDGKPFWIPLVRVVETVPADTRQTVAEMCARALNEWSGCWLADQVLPR
jgi:hypothetical protein